MVNRLNTTVAVGQGISHLENVVDKDLTNGATFVNVVKAIVGTEPTFTIRDTKHVYAANTTVGFVVNINGKVLGLNVVKASMRIFFYRNGQPLSTPSVECDQKEGSALQVTLVSTGDNTVEYTAKAPGDFDEIGLAWTGGLSADVASAMTIKYAFVGKNGKYYIDSEDHNGIEDFKKAVKKAYPGTEFNDDKLILGQVQGLTFKNPDASGNTIDNKSEDFNVTPITVSAYGGNDETKNMPFKKGMTVGFETSGEFAKLLGGLQVKQWTITSKDGKKFDWGTGTVASTNFTVLGLNLGLSHKDILSTLTKDCNAIELAAVGIDAANVYRMFVIMPPSIDDDDPHLSVSADRGLCDEHQSVTLHSDEKVTWKCTSQPEGSSSLTIGECTQDEKSKLWNCEVKDFVNAGTYTFTATATDGSNRTAVTNVTYGISPVIDTAIRPWVNNFTEKGVSYNADGKAYMDKYKIVSFSLIPEIKSGLDNLVTPSLDDYASAGGISLLNKKMICGVFRTKPYSYTGEKSDKVTVGFVTRTKWAALNLSLLNGLEVRVFNAGSEVKTISSSNNHFKVLSADLIDGDTYVTTEYTVEVDQATPFDAITLWNTGLLDAKLSDFNIYYAFVEPSAQVNSYNNSVANSWQTISRSQTGASIDASLLGGVGVATVASTTENINDIIDDDLTTGVAIKGVATVGNSSTIAVKLGKVYDGGHQVQILTFNQDWLHIDLAKFITLKAYLNGNPVSQKTNWKVLGVNVIGGMNNEAEIIWTPTDDKTNKPVDFDEISITLTGVAGVVNDTWLYGIRVTSDADGDGIPDVNDEESCPNSAFLMDENEPSLDKAHDFTSSKMYLHRTFNSGKWSTICLPVDLTFNQFISAFGNEARLATPEDCKDETPNTIQFNIPETHGNQVLLHKNTPYIIKVINEGNSKIADEIANAVNADNGTEGKLKDEQQRNFANYKAKTNITNADDAKKYIIYGVSYNTTEENQKSNILPVTCSHKRSDFWPMSTITWNGTFVCPQTITGPFYTFLLKPKDETKDADFVYYENKNKNGITGFRGLRCWMTTDEQSTSKAKELTLAFGNEEISNGTATGINEVKSPVAGNGNIYTLTGVLIRRAATSTEGLSKGIYIWNNKKIEIK